MLYLVVFYQDTTLSNSSISEYVSASSELVVENPPGTSSCLQTRVPAGAEVALLSSDLLLSEDSENSDLDQAPVVPREKKAAETTPSGASRCPRQTGSSKTRRRRRNSSSSTSSSGSSSSSAKRRRRVSSSSPLSRKSLEKGSAKKTVETSQESLGGNSPLSSPDAASTPIVSSLSAAAATSTQKSAGKPREKVAVAGSSKGPEGELSVGEYIAHLEQNRNAEQELPPEKCSRLRKPFIYGWRRKCIAAMARGGTPRIVCVVYISPSDDRCSNKQQIQKCLEKSPESGLTLENFDLGKSYLGFFRDQELITKSSFHTHTITEVNFPNTVTEVQKKPPKWGKFVLIKGNKKGIKCIYPSCEKSVSRTVPAHNRHVLGRHTAAAPCPECGRLVTAVNMERHLNGKKCKKRDDGNNNLNERKSSKKRKEMRKIGSLQPGPSHVNTTDARKEVRKERIPVESPASQLISKDRIKTELRDQSVSAKLNTELKALLTFQTEQKNGKRTIRVKIEKVKTLNQQIQNLLRKWEQDAGLNPSEAVWVCEGKILRGEETGGSLDGKYIVLKKTSEV